MTPAVRIDNQFDTPTPDDDDGSNQDADVEFGGLDADFEFIDANEELIGESELLEGYSPDSSYNPTSMEEDGLYPNQLQWKYEDLPENGLEEDIYRYEGSGPSLRRNVANKFSSPLQACAVAGGFTYDLIKRITANSNAYASKSKGTDNRFAGSPWTPITVEEMYHALGIILKMSVDNRQIGGWGSYFNAPTEMKYTPSQSISIDGFSSWASDIMSFYRFRQIRAALHPETGSSLVNDKCHQLRASIQSLNEHARRAFILGRECSFDEGGIASKSRYNPVRQYNSSKPDKYRIDFFVLVNASSGKNFIYHIDVYQGKNATNAHIAEEAWSLPTTQKAVVNAVISSGIDNDPEGMREIYMDNRYTSPDLFVLLREKYKILACGTIRTNRKGWDPSIMNLSKSSPRGTSLTKYDPINKVLFGQWNDNKVVSFISTLGVSGLVTVQRRVGRDKVDFQIEEALKRYTRDNFMGGVDNVDKDKKIGGSFTKKALFKKWYLMGLMGIFDFMLVNGRIAWNMSCTDESCANRRFELSNADYRCIVAHELLQYRDVRNIDLIAESSLLRNAMGRPLLSDHQPSNTEKGTRVRCCVCRLEDGIHNILKKTSEGRKQMEDVLGVASAFHMQKGSYIRKWIARCASDKCTLYAHCIPVKSDNLIFRLEQFQGLTCFEIAHHPDTKGLWMCNLNHKKYLSQLGHQTNNTRETFPRAYNLQTSHPLYVKLREAYGLQSIQRGKGGLKTTGLSDEESYED
jgi:hypothetical protein